MWEVWEARKSWMGFINCCRMSRKAARRAQERVLGYWQGDLSTKARNGLYGLLGGF